jgi:RimJ/RimL family protein N-acetyltransferase
MRGRTVTSPDADFLETDRLALRRFTEADEDNLFELNRDPEVIRFLNGGPTPRDEVRTRIIPTFLGYYERFEGFGFWAAVEMATGQFLGAAGHADGLWK